MTLGKIIIDLSDKEFASGLTYTAVTRVRRAADMSFRPFPNFIRYQLALKLSTLSTYSFSDWLKFSSLKPSRKELQKKQEKSIFVIIVKIERIVTVIKQRKSEK